jgi:hypothetical protein
MLEDGGDSVAPPARPRPTAAVSLLLNKPALANLGCVRRSADNHDAFVSNDEDSVDENEANERNGPSTVSARADQADQADHANAAQDSGDQAEVTADESGNTGGEDRRSPSPAPQGASRTAGGHLRGRAHGNAFNFSDNAAAHDPVTLPLMGHVLLYDDRAANAVPIFAVKQPVVADLKSVLSTLAMKFSPVRSMHFSYLCCDLR